MLWIGAEGSNSLIERMEQDTGLRATVLNGEPQYWRQNIDEYRVMVIQLPAPREVLQAALTVARGGTTPLPIVIYDERNTLDEGLIGPPLTSVRCVNGKDSAAMLGGYIRQAVEQSDRNRLVACNEPWKEFLVGESQSMRELHGAIRLIGPMQSTVLITGESGTGKELVARAIHMASQRASAEMVAVNCGALPESLVEAELFGHARGAFTGAIGQRTGRFEQAHRGTIFLDEVGEIPLPMQPKLLRVLQEKELQRVGSSETMRVDVRIIAASNVDLELAILDKRFREDLYYRLNVVPIHVAPLRERRDDIPLLATHFIEKVCQREDLPLKRLTRAAMDLLSCYGWPGNVRQLEHCVEMAVTLSGQRETLYVGDFNLLKAPVVSISPDAEDPDTTSFSNMGFEQIIGRMEKRLLEEAIRSCGGNKAKAAKLLGLKRTTLLYKMKAAEGTAQVA